MSPFMNCLMRRDIWGICKHVYADTYVHEYKKSKLVLRRTLNLLYEMFEFLLEIGGEGCLLPISLLQTQNYLAKYFPVRHKAKTFQQ